ncbi:hypothetical protein AHF37_01678 [Paragonimus kellicotti]|nr:hypothetical protein AHF37_01678 [Paragonimus kellicotti]
MQIADFDADPQPFPTANSDTWSNRRDSNNQGLIAYSEARLVGRPWYNGARVSCQLEWEFADSYADITTSGDQPPNLTDYTKPVYLATEILFAPSAISLSVSPRNGIQELHGHQIFECATTSSIPPSQITWLLRRPDSQQGDGADDPVNAVDYAMFENPLKPSRNDIVIESGVSVETVPGLYGGKRVVSRLRLLNITREQDRSLLICKVDHVEWVKSVGRLHRIVVLFPPSLQIVTKQMVRNHEPLYSRSILKCVPEGGRPTFPFNLDDREFGSSDISPPQEDTLTSNVNRPIANSSQSMVNESSLWKFSWYFYPTYPDGLFSSPQNKLVSPSRSTDIHQYGSVGQHPVLVLDQPERKQAGEYVCQLDGPGGRVQASTKLDFPFAPSAISLSVSPRNGIQELHGHQIFECATTSSIPPSQITWLLRRPDSQQGDGADDPVNAVDYAMFENPLKPSRNDIVIESGVSVETEHVFNLASLILTVKNSVPPELIPSGITVFTAPVGYQAVIELYIWSHPLPRQRLPMIERYSTPTRSSKCERSKSKRTIAGELLRQERFNYSWFKVVTKSKTSDSQVLSRRRTVIELYIWSHPLPRQRLPMIERYSTPTRSSKCERSKSKRTIAGELLRQERFNYSWFKVVTKSKTSDSQVLSRRRLVDTEQKVTHDDQNAERMRVWSDVVLVNLATIYPEQSSNLPNHQTNDTNSKITMSIPTLVFRLFFHVVTETDYGEYVCELKHITGRKTFLARLQPPVHTNNCLDRLIEHPEKGTAMIHLAINHHLSFTKAFAQQPMNSESPADASEQLPEESLINEDINTPVDWWTTTKQMVYQFRFYNMHGSLVHSGDWHIYKPETTSDQVSRRPAMSLPLWLTLGVVVLIAIILAVLVFLVHRKVRRKRNKQPMAYMVEHWFRGLDHAKIEADSEWEHSDLVD